MQQTKETRDFHGLLRPVINIRRGSIQGWRLVLPTPLADDGQAVEAKLLAVTKKPHLLVSESYRNGEWVYLFEHNWKGD